MSRGARWTLGFFALFFAAAILYSESISPSKAPIAVFCFAVFCVLIAIACFSHALRGPAVRVVGGTVFLVGVYYLVSELTSKADQHYIDRAHPHWFNAIQFLVVFGLPGLYVALRGSYPVWGRGAKAFLGENQTQR